MVIDNNIILIGGLNKSGDGAAITGEFVRSGTKPGTWRGELFDLKNDGLMTCAVSYQGGFVTMGGATHRKVDRSRHLTIPCRNPSLFARYNSEGNFLNSLPDLLQARALTTCTTFTSSDGEEVLWFISFYWSQQGRL